MPARLHTPPSRCGVSESFIAKLLIIMECCFNSFGFRRIAYAASP
jgi:hypothetical protein